MSALLVLSRGIDAFNKVFGQLAEWLVLVAALISAGNAAARYLFNASSNAWLEIQWYMFSGMFLLGAAYTLKHNEHVRVDLIYSSVSDRARLWIDIFGLVFVLLPAMTILAYMGWPFFYDAFERGEISGNAGGLLRWPVKLIMPVGFTLVALQGVSELIKRVAALRGLMVLETKYDKPLQ
jgi:TRAP-type mannitol/chloroaromatic compound transport system permease small subunit